MRRNCAERENVFPRRRSNLKKCEESLSRMQAQLEDNVKLMAELGEQLKKLENEAGEIMTAFKEAEVGPALAWFCTEMH